ncbi:hypothetical protein AVEN_88447-1 [Araneus ventricosus]|uniref:Uncharacterized protein n=1 Tax=Araneus ventricosus TaxID=182803 RepID=A0A4Y2TGQ3_ARAVE|nr:hypothetical protein AVEN_88447-1 [Araneus ventricosus]
MGHVRPTHGGMTRHYKDPTSRRSKGNPAGQTRIRHLDGSKGNEAGQTSALILGRDSGAIDLQTPKISQPKRTSWGSSLCQPSVTVYSFKRRVNWHGLSLPKMPARTLFSASQLPSFFLHSQSLSETDLKP